MKLVITGARGFVGHHLVDALARRLGADAVIVPTAKRPEAHPVLGVVEELDVTDRAAVGDFIGRVRPTHVVHLAGVTAPPDAARDPAAAWRVNVDGTLNLAWEILARAPDCALLFVGSGHVYGRSATSGRALDEDTLLAPLDDYAATKAAADLALGALVERGLQCIRFRPFNHTGPGQSERFAIPSFAMQVARIEAGLAPPVLRVGNLDAERDFSDVRDVVAAYGLGIEQQDRLPAGLILNIASGVPRQIGDILDRLCASSPVPIDIETDSERMRRSEIPRLVGDASRAREMLGWTPTHDLDETIAALLTDCRQRVAAGSS